MNRRSFLSSLGLLTLAAATPKIIFDLGANLHHYPKVELIRREFRTPDYLVSDILGAQQFEETFGKIVQEIYHQATHFKEYGVETSVFLEGLKKNYIMDNGSCLYKAF